MSLMLITVTFDAHCTAVNASRALMEYSHAFLSIEIECVGAAMSGCEWMSESEEEINVAKSADADHYYHLRET